MEKANPLRRCACAQRDIVTTVKDRSSNRVRAILRIRNTQVEDGGVYKCVLRVFEKRSYRLTKIVVDNS